MAADINKLKGITGQVRRDIIRMVHGSKSGHPGASLGCTEFFVALYFHCLKHDPKFNMDGVEKIYSSFPMAIFHQSGIAPWPGQVILK
jgi:transketolase